MKSKKFLSTMLAVAICILAFAGCNKQQEGVMQGESSNSSQSGAEATKDFAGKEIVFDDTAVTVEGEKVESGTEKEGVSVGGDIIYYHDMDYYASGNEYGDGNNSDRHTAEEAAGQTLVTITEAGTYRISGSLKGQLAVDLGENAVSDPDAVVSLVLDGVDITCDIAPAVIFYNVYECSDSAFDTKGKADTAGAGANVVIADGSENRISGSYVAEIYKDGSNEECFAKFDGAFYSKQSININGGDLNTGKLYIEAENEGLCSELHLTVNGGNIYINAQDDGINTNEDRISVTTVNGGYLYVNGGLGEEGDGIDSNGYITVNGGTVFAVANGRTGDGGIDADCDITVNGGTLMAFGSRNESISENSLQNCMELSFNLTRTADKGIAITAPDGNTVIEAICEREFSYASFSSPKLEQNTEYTVTLDGTKQSYTAMSIDFDINPGIIGGGRSDKIVINDPIVTELPEGFEEWMKSDTNIPENIREWLEDISRSITGQPIEVPRPVEPRLETQGNPGAGEGQMSTEGQQPNENQKNNPASEKSDTNSVAASDKFVLTDIITRFIGVKDA